MSDRKSESPPAPLSPRAHDQARLERMLGRERERSARDRERLERERERELERIKRDRERLKRECDRELERERLNRERHRDRDLSRRESERDQAVAVLDRITRGHAERYPREREREPVHAPPTGVTFYAPGGVVAQHASNFVVTPRGIITLSVTDAPAAFAGGMAAAFDGGGGDDDVAFEADMVRALAASAASARAAAASSATTLVPPPPPPPPPHSPPLCTIDVPKRPVEKEPSASNEQRACVVCLDRAIKTALQPCGHACMCVTCANDLIDAKHSESACPMCRKRIARIDLVSIC